MHAHGSVLYMHACVCGSLLSSILSPTTSNVVKKPFQLSELHSEVPGSSNACTVIFGQQAGARLDMWMVTNFKWLLAAVAGSMVVQKAWRSVPTVLLYNTLILVLSIPLALCLDVRVVKKLLNVAGAWYFILSVVGGQVSWALIFGPRWWLVDGTVDDMKQFSSLLGAVATALGLIVGGAFIDAIPPRIFSPRARMWFTALVFVYKSGSSICLVHHFLI